MKKVTILFSSFLLLSSTFCYSQSVEIKGDFNGQSINYSSTEVSGTLEVYQIDIGFPSIPLVDIKALEIKGLNYNQNNNGKTFSIVEKPNNEGEVRVELNIANTCSGDIKCKNGNLVIEELSDNNIIASGFVVFENNSNQFSKKAIPDTLIFDINAPLFDAIPKLANEELEDNYQFENITISGELSEEFIYGSEFKNKALLGNVEFRIGYIEIEMEEPNNGKDIEIELWAAFSSMDEFSAKNRFDKKLKPGKYEIIPMPEFDDSTAYVNSIKSLKRNQIFGQIDDDKIYEDFPIMGELIIEHISDKRMKGSFDLQVLHEDRKEYLSGKFEVPVEIR
jgi:hypothetical protein